LDELRGITPVENIIIPEVHDNIITQSPNTEMLIGSELNKKVENTNVITLDIADNLALDSNTTMFDNIQIMNEISQCNELNLIEQENDKIIMLTAQNYDEMEYNKMAHENIYDSGR
jgi:hypothetical protein